MGATFRDWSVMDGHRGVSEVLVMFDLLVWVLVTQMCNQEPDCWCLSQLNLRVATVALLTPLTLSIEVSWRF